MKRKLFFLPLLFSLLFSCNKLENSINISSSSNYITSINDTSKTDTSKNDSSSKLDDEYKYRIKFEFDDKTTYASLLDNSVTRDLISRLPLNLSFSDYNNTEKIAYLPKNQSKLDTSSCPNKTTPQKGDITLYAPWGNLAIFYKPFRESTGLVPLGKLDDNEIDKFEKMSSSFDVTISLVTSTIKEYDVTYVIDENNSKIVKVKENSYASSLEDVIKDGYILDNWYKDKDYKEVFDFNKEKITKNTVIYAKWIKKEIENKKSLVLYFSYSNKTKSVADKLTSKLDATEVEIIPPVKYTSADVNYNDSNSRSQTERINDSRPEISEETYSKIDLSLYDYIFIGHPIWNNYEPMIIRTLFDHYTPFLNKKIYTFSTSASSSGSNAFSSLKTRYSAVSLIDNIHFTSSTLNSSDSIISSTLTRWNII